VNEILLRNDASLADVDVKQRIIDMIAVPWNQEADVPWRGEMWREVFRRGAFDGIEDHAGRIRVNRQHVAGDTVGKVVQLEPSADIGMLARVRIADTLRGDETLQLAEEDMLSPSIAWFAKSSRDVNINKRTKVREVLRAFLDHLALVESPAYAGARVLAVREAPSGLTVAEQIPLPTTPALDEAQNDPVLMWARERLAATE
jgi:phage head maturation protease